MNSLDEKSLLADRYLVYERNRPFSRRDDRDEIWFFEPADCRAILDSPNLSSQRSGLANRLERAGFHLLSDFFRQWLMYTDGAAHNSRRSAVVRALRQIAPDPIVARSPISNQTEFDLIGDFCEPYVWCVLPRLLGLTTEEREFWRPRIAPLVALPGNDNPDIQLMRTAELGLKDLHQSLLSKPCRLLLLLNSDLGPSIETTNLAINVIGDGIHPTIAALASEIFLRLSPTRSRGVGSSHLLFHYDPPFQFAARLATDRTDIREIRVETGQRVVACLGAANRASDGQPPMTFGYGRHACVGRAHAERCIQSGLAAFTEWIAGRTLQVGEPRWTKSIGYRMIEALEIQISPA